MTPREEAALEAQKALAHLILIGRQSGALWPEEEKTLTEAMRIAQKHADAR